MDQLLLTQVFTNSTSIYKLNGLGYQIGGYYGIPVYGIPLAVGAEVNAIPDHELNRTSFGATRSLGFGTPGSDFHIEWGQTTTWTHFNIFDTAKGIYIKIMEW